MNIQVSTGYAATAHADTDPGRAEALVLSRLAAGMIRASGLGKLGFAALATAVHENRRFWRMAALDLVGEGNELPQGLRVQLLSLAQFVEQETARVLQGGKNAEALIEVNRAIARGLFERPG